MGEGRKLGLFGAPFRPAWICGFVLDPVRMIRLGIKWLRVALSTSEACEALKVITVSTMHFAEVKPASIATVRFLSGTHVRQPAVNHFAAIRMVAPRGDAVADIALPPLVISDRPAHIAHPLIGNPNVPQPSRNNRNHNRKFGACTRLSGQ